MRRRSGFTLIELIVVVLIISILAAIGLPQYFKVVERARIAEANSILTSVRSAQENFLNSDGAYALTNAGVAKFDITMGGDPPTFGMKYYFMVIGSGDPTGCESGNPFYNVAFVRIANNAGVAPRYFENYMMVYERCTNAVTFPGCPNCTTDFMR